MKILFTVEFYEPQKGGAEEVVKQLAERLSKIGHIVTVATTYIQARIDPIINGVRVEGFALSGNTIRGIRGTDEEIQRYKDFLQGDFDIVVNYATQIWTTDLAFGVLTTMPAKKILVSCGYTLKNENYRAYLNDMPNHLVNYDRIVYMSEEYHDKVFHNNTLIRDKAVIIPNGAAEEEFLASSTVDIKKKLGIQTPYIALCVSNHYAAKGHDFVIKAFKKMNRTDTTLLIIGEIPSFGFKKIAHAVVGCYKNCYLESLLSTRIKIASGKNRDFILSAYKSADVFLFGSRIECAPLVMYESFASKTPFITTEVGNVKDHMEYIKIIATPQEMAQTANHFLDNEESRNLYAERAFVLWKEHHTWGAIVNQYEKLLENLL